MYLIKTYLWLYKWHWILLYKKISEIILHTSAWIRWVKFLLLPKTFCIKFVYKIIKWLPNIAQHWNIIMSRLIFFCYVLQWIFLMFVHRILTTLQLKFTLVSRNIILVSSRMWNSGYNLYFSLHFFHLRKYLFQFPSFRVFSTSLYSHII